MDLECIISYLFLCSLFLQIVLLPFSFSFLPPGNETDRLSLLAFKDQINNDPLGKLSSWNESLHFCDWSGVTCGRKHRRVVELDLRSCQLEGSLSPHIGNLSFLRILNLQNNSFSHDIPPEIGRLFRLQMLVVRNNTFSGEIPVNISQCSNLWKLWVGKNNLTGKLPTELGSLTKLKSFVFEVNNLVGEIPSSFGNLSSILEIYGPENHLQGGIPSSIGKLRELREFSFDANNLVGTIPVSIYNLSFLTALAVAGNQLQGSLPANLGYTLPNIEILSLADNRFTGLVPATLSNASNAFAIYLSMNFLTGKVPSLASLPDLRVMGVQINHLGNGEDDDMSFLHDLANNTNLEKLHMNDNNFGGVLPEIVSNFSKKLRLMTAGRNLIRGSIPRDIGNLINLNALTLEENQLTGTIPSSIGKLPNLVELYLDGNKITGSIPSSLGNITSLTKVYLEENNLQGRIPSSLGNCRNMLALALRQNNLSGPIPKEITRISSLSLQLDLSGNQLTGNLPLEVEKLVNLENLDVSENKLSGEIPRTLGSCTSMEYLNLGGNFFQGSIPSYLSSLKAIMELNLSHNKLTGQIPMFLSELKLLTSLDLSCNDLEGEVPTLGVFENATAISVLGNKRLCGGIQRVNLSKCTSRERKSSSKLTLMVAIPGGFLAIISIVASPLLYFRKKTKNKSASGDSWEISFRRATYEDLLQATDGFTSSNLIGAGSFGSVYKGILPSDGAVVAVKVIDLLRKGASKSFMAECEALINIRHRNLVKVLTACSSIDFQGNDFKALVYEFMINGSLEEWLHPNHIPNEARESRYLNLNQRMNIAIDVANALDYLHHQCQIPIVHCDLKPSNILLDGDMTAHVGDFGLARFHPKPSNQLSLDQISSVGLEGTIGYTAPEYCMGSEASCYGDVYSYGILLLEMFTGKKPTDGLFKEGPSLHNYVKMALHDQVVVEIVDPMILREAEETSAHASHILNKILKCLISVMKVGIACSQELPTERMDISNVAAELHRIRNILLGTRYPR